MASRYRYFGAFRPSIGQVKGFEPSTLWSRMAALILSSPALQFGQRCMSMSNTGLSSRAQLMRCTGAFPALTSHLAAAAASLAGYSCAGGTTSERSLAFGTNTPWNRIRCSLGRGSSAASR